MTNVDRFESIFRGASRPVFDYAPPPIRRALVVTDLEERAVERFADEVADFLGALGDAVSFAALCADDLGTVGDLLARVEREQADLVCTFRHLKSDAWRWPYSLGEHVDVLTQVTDVPVLLLPHPERSGRLPHALQNTDRVAAASDRLAGRDRLVNHAVRFAAEGGTLFLAHVEDARIFERFLDAVSKIPDLDTEIARREVKERLLQDAKAYVESVRRTLGEKRSDLGVEALLRFGHPLDELHRLVDEFEVDLLVLDTKDDTRFAMSDLAYSMAVEMRTLPLLLI